MKIKKVLSLLLSLAMIFSFMQIPAFAAATDVVMNVSASTGSINTLKEGSTVTVTVSLPSGLTCASTTVELSFDKEKFEIANDADIENKGVSTITNRANANAGGFVSGVIMAFSDTTYSAEKELYKVKFTVKDGAAGTAEFKINSEKTKAVKADKSDAGLTLPAATIVTILKTPIKTVATATVDDPAKGVALDTTVNCGDNAGYTGTVEWYEGDSAAGTVATGTAKASQVYTAKITLTADTSKGENFATGTALTGPEGYTVTSNDGTTVVMTKTFAATNDKDTPTVTAPSGITVTYGDAVANTSLSEATTAGTAKFGENTVAGSFEWMSTVTSYGNAGTNTLKAKFVPTNTTDYATVENIDVAVTVQKKSIAVVVEDIDSQTYTGVALTPSVALIPTGLVGDDTLVKNTDYEVEYTNNTDVGTANVTVKPKTGSNYTFVQATKQFKITKATATITFNEPGTITYDGAGVAAAKAETEEAASADIIYNYTGDVTEFEVKYYADNNGVRSVSPCTTTPKDAGTYWIGVSAAEGTNYAAVEQFKKFTISPKSISDDEITITLGTQKTYDGTEQNVVITSVKDGSKDLVLDTDYEITTGGKATNVQNTTLTITGKGNYKDTKTKTWSLVKATPKQDDFSVTAPDAAGYAYTGSAIEATKPTTTKTGMGDITVKYKQGEGEATASAPINVGDYTVTFEVAGGTNYMPWTNGTIGTLKINKVDYTGTKTGEATVRSNQVNNDVTYTLPTLPAGASYAATGTVGGTTTDLISGTPSVANGILTYSTTSQLDSTSATITVKVTGATNYKDYDFVLTVTAKDKEDAGVTITSTVPTSKTYGDANFNVTASKTVAGNDGTWTWTSSDETILKVVSGGDTATATVQVLKADATGATLTAKYESDTHLGKATTAAITVDKKELTITGATATNRTYDGTTTVTVSGGTLSGVITADANDTAKLELVNTGASGSITNANVGNSKAVEVTGYALSGTSKDNYTLTQPTDVTVNINKAELTISGATLASKTYDGTTDATVDTVTFGGLVSGETLTKNTDFSATAEFDNANAGDGKTATVTVTLKTTNATKNYTLPTATYELTGKSIAKASAPTLTALTKSVKAGITAEQSVDLSKLMPKGAAGNGKLTYKLGNDTGVGDVIIEVDVSEAGVVTFQLKDKNVTSGSAATLKVTIESQNYEKATATVYISVVDKDVPEIVASDINVTYTGENVDCQKSKAVARINGQPVDGTFAWVGTAPKNAGTGVYNIEFRPKDDDTYATVTTGITVTINKAKVSGTPAFTKVSEANKKLSDVLDPSKVSGLTPAGAFAWDLGNDTEVVKGTEYTWTYTPTDTANYEVLTGKVTPWATSSGSGGGGGGAASTVQKPSINSGNGGSYTLSKDGSTATITPKDGYEIDKVTVNGKEVTLKDGKLTGLKTGDKVEVTYKQTSEAADKQISEIKEKVAALELMARSSRTSKKNIKVVVKMNAEAQAAIEDIQSLGYTVKYKFYRSTKKAASYKGKFTSQSGEYTNTIGKKGTMYYYKARVQVYDANGSLVTQTELKQCKYANRKWVR